MPRTRKGSTVILKDGTMWARVRYLDEQGKRTEHRKLAKNQTDADKKIKQMIRELDDHGPRALDASMTFGRWLDEYEKVYVTEPEYRGERKISGLRSWKKTRSMLKALRAHLGKKKLIAITYTHLKEFRNTRLQTLTSHKEPRPRAIASVNREMSLLRRVFKLARQDGWITKDPFHAGEPLIHSADEVQRERTLSYEEEDRLLSVCTGQRQHLRPILVCALDTGMRRGEIITLTWGDVDLEGRSITVRALNTKTIKKRSIIMSNRLHAELTWLWESSTQLPAMRVFGIENTFKRAFAGACRDAKISDFRFHDCRHTTATRWIKAGMSLYEVGRILGHTVAQTTYRYVSADESSRERAAEILNEIHRRREEESTEAQSESSNEA